MELVAADAFSMKSILMLSPFLNNNGVLPYMTWSGIVSSISICQISMVFTVLRLNTMLDVVRIELVLPGPGRQKTNSVYD